jgi:predicted RNase H-like HicB family nuclease
MTSKKYVAIFEKSKTGYSAYCPDLPGVGVAVKTYAQTRKFLPEGIDIYIEECLADGLDVPEPTTRSESLDVKVA